MSEDSLAALSERLMEAVETLQAAISGDREAKRRFVASTLSEMEGSLEGANLSEEEKESLREICVLDALTSVSSERRTEAARELLARVGPFYVQQLYTAVLGDGAVPPIIVSMLSHATALGFTVGQMCEVRALDADDIDIYVTQTRRTLIQKGVM